MTEYIVVCYDFDDSPDEYNDMIWLRGHVDCGCMLGVERAIRKLYPKWEGGDFNYLATPVNEIEQVA